MKLNTINTDVQLHIFRFLEFSDWSQVSLVCRSFNSFLDTTYRTSELIKEDVTEGYRKKESECKQLRKTEEKNSPYRRKVFLNRVAESVCYFTFFNLIPKLMGELPELFDFDKPPLIFNWAIAGIGFFLASQHCRSTCNLFPPGYFDIVSEKFRELDERRMIKENLIIIRRFEKIENKGNLGIFDSCGDNKKLNPNEKKPTLHFPWLRV